MSDIARPDRADKRRHVARRKARAPAGRGRAAARAAAAAARLRRPLWPRQRPPGRYGLIAEIKKASPQQGPDPRRFRSRRPSPAPTRRRRHLPLGADRRALFPGQRRASRRRRAPPSTCRCCARTSCSIPTRSPKSRALGADCVLLIMAALDDAQAAELAGRRSRLGHGRAGRGARRGRARARARLPARLIGVNNRNLKTLTVDLATTEQPGAPRAAATACWWPRAGSARRPIWPAWHASAPASSSSASP